MRRRGRTARAAREADRFTQLPNFLLNSVAVRTLEPSDFMTLVYMAKRCYGAKDNGHIVFGVRGGCLILSQQKERYEEAAIGVGKSAIAVCLERLELRGLIRCTKEFTFKQKKKTREWRLTWLPTIVDGVKQPPTNEFFYFREEPSSDGHRDLNGDGSKNRSQSAPPDCNEGNSPVHRTTVAH